MLGQGSFLGRRILGRLSSWSLGKLKVVGGMMAFTFIRLGALEVVATPPYIFLIGGLLSLFSNYPLLMASLILVPQSHNSPKELIGDDRSLLLYVRSKFLIIMFIWSLSFGLDAFPFHLVMYSENVSPTPCLAIPKSLKVTSIWYWRWIDLWITLLAHSIPWYYLNLGYSTTLTHLS